MPNAEMHTALDVRMAAATTVIRAAGELAMSCFQSFSTLTVERKGVQDIVSEADRRVEKLVRARLLAQFPEDGFLGEESGGGESLGASEYAWIVDPIDGTDCFLRGIGVWCVSIALVRGAEIEFGFVFDPNAGEMFSARRNAGATCNTAPINASTAVSLSEGIVGIGFSHRVTAAPTLAVLSNLLAANGMYQRNGSGALMLAYVASGRYLGYFEAHINSWDCLAGILLVREAGGWTSDFLAGDGLTRGNSLIASAPGTMREMRAICAPAIAT